jgi:hypothetical protein
MVESLAQPNPDAETRQAKAEICLDVAHRIVRNSLTGLDQIEFEIVYLGLCGFEFSQGYLVGTDVADIGLVEMFLLFHAGNHEEWTYGLEELWQEFPKVMTSVLMMFSLANKFFKSRGHDGIKLSGHSPRPWVNYQSGD